MTQIARRKGPSDGGRTPWLVEAGSTVRPLGVLLLRPQAQSVRIAEWVKKRGGVAHIHPCLVVEQFSPPPFLRALSSVPGTQTHMVVLTSVHAAEAVVPHIGRLAEKALCFAVGKRTAEVLAQAGISVTSVGESETANASQLAKTVLRALSDLPKPVRLLFPQAEEAREELPLKLAEAGVPVESIVVYRTRAVSPEALAPAVSLLRTRQIDLLPFGSPRTVRIFVDALGEEAAALLEPVCVGAIGETTAQALRALGVRVDEVGKQALFETLLTQMAARFLV